MMPALAFEVIVDDLLRGSWTERLHYVVVIAIGRQTVIFQCVARMGARRFLLVMW